jgi:hypothetical protein
VCIGAHPVEGGAQFRHRRSDRPTVGGLLSVVGEHVAEQVPNLRVGALLRDKISDPSSARTSTSLSSSTRSMYCRRAWTMKNPSALAMRKVV